MTTGTNRMIGKFAKKPKTQSFYEGITSYASGLGDIKKTVKAQVSFSAKRKFLWMWAYEKTPDGTLYLTVCLDKEISNPHFKYVKQVSKNRWSHHIEVKTSRTAKSAWLKKLIKEGYEFALF